MAAVIELLSNAIQDIENLIIALADLSCTSYDSQKLDGLAAKLGDAAVSIQKKTGSFRLSREEQAWKASEVFRTRAQSTITTLFDDGKLKNSPLFRRNIVLIFAEPKHSDLDSKEMKARKVLTQRRCERIRKLNPDGIVSWAICYTPTEWGGGAMRNDVFDCLIEDIDPKSTQAWPTAVCEMLKKLKDADLRDSSDYKTFVDGENIIAVKNSCADFG
jgi:hypothetical protein